MLPRLISSSWTQGTLQPQPPEQLVLQVPDITLGLLLYFKFCFRVRQASKTFLVDVLSQELFRLASSCNHVMGA
jgi:hypothetical protein